MTQNFKSECPYHAQSKDNTDMHSLEYTREVNHKKNTRKTLVATLSNQQLQNKHVEVGSMGIIFIHVIVKANEPKVNVRDCIFLNSNLLTVSKVGAVRTEYNIHLSCVLYALKPEINKMILQFWAP